MAQLEAPDEIKQNNQVISTRIALALQDQLVGNITENLPHICACTYLADEKRRDIYDEKMREYEQCLVQQELERMPSSNPSFHPSMHPSFHPSMHPSFMPSVDPNATLNGTDLSLSLPEPVIESSLPTSSDNNIGSNNNTGSNNSTEKEPIQCDKPESLQTEAIEMAIQNVFASQFKRCFDNPTNKSLNPFDGNSNICTEIGKTTTFQDHNISTSALLTEMKNCGSEALKIAEEYKLDYAIIKSLSDASLSWNWIRCTGNGFDVGYQARKNLNQLFVSSVFDLLFGTVSCSLSHLALLHCRILG